MQIRQKIFIDDINLSTAQAKQRLSSSYLMPETDLVSSLSDFASLSQAQSRQVQENTQKMIRDIRQQSADLTYVDHLMLEYSLSSKEGILLMRIAEALLRTPDVQTSVLFMRDCLSAGNWRSHRGHGATSRVNLTTEALNFAHGWIQTSGGAQGLSLMAKLGDKLLLTALQHAMQVMGNHFVLARDITSALRISHAHRRQDDPVYSPVYSYDMLGEAAITQTDAAGYHQAYFQAAQALADQITGDQMPKDGSVSAWQHRDGLSVKLSALHPRYDILQTESCLPILYARVKQLAEIAYKAGFGLTIDAEEVERLEISLLVVERLLEDPDLPDWQGLSIVVQAYQRRAIPVLQYLIKLASDHQRQIAVRLVKGAYWDREIKRAQELGLSSYPVFTRKEHTDLSYLACSKLLLSVPDQVYPQFATHNVQTALTILAMAESQAVFEFQRLHGMGKELHQLLHSDFGKTSRIYAPVGQHTDLLPYLVRRLLENGANCSFVNQLYDQAISPDELAILPNDIAQMTEYQQSDMLKNPRDQFNGDRMSAMGIDLRQHHHLSDIKDWLAQEYQRSIVPVTGAQAVYNPARASDIVGYVSETKIADLPAVFQSLSGAQWQDISVAERCATLNRVATLLEDEIAVFLPILVREAGKIWLDAVAEIREAIDFCRYYALQSQDQRLEGRQALGTIICISPWNFPLAIFLGQVCAALSVGNSVIAKPAPQTPLVAQKAIDLLYRAGVPRSALHLVIGGAEIGAALTAASETAGICFTGSTASAKKIAASLADTNRCRVPLIAETGGLNVMIIDSTALLEQAVTDVVTSAFQSAGQRCSACRIVCVQEDIADDFVHMLQGAMQALKIGDPIDPATDIGPVIDQAAADKIKSYSQSRSVLAPLALPEVLSSSQYVAPVAIELDRLDQVSEEIFGPVLHIVRFKGENFADIITEINHLGYGLTLGLHTRIDHRQDYVCDHAHIGNIYINRNQIGAIVGVQPFGGEGLSGTGPKAGGPYYLLQLTRSKKMSQAYMPITPADVTKHHRTKADKILINLQKKAQKPVDATDIAQLLSIILPTLLSEQTAIMAEYQRDVDKINILPGPTGEANTLRLVPRGVILMRITGDLNLDRQQIARLLIAGNSVIIEENSQTGWISEMIRQMTQSIQSMIDRCHLVSRSIFQALSASDIHGIALPWQDRTDMSEKILKRSGSILPIFVSEDPLCRYMVERTVSIDITAAGGNVDLMRVV